MGAKVKAGSSEQWFATPDRQSSELSLDTLAESSERVAATQGLPAGGQSSSDSFATLEKSSERQLATLPSGVAGLPKILKVTKNDSRYSAATLRYSGFGEGVPAMHSSERRIHPARKEM